MINPEEAYELVLKSVRRGSPVTRKLDEAACLVSARQIAAPRSYPFFSYSAMDGYAVFSGDLEDASCGVPVTLPLVGEARAAGGEPPRFSDGRTIRIMTGAVVPKGCNAVVKREDVIEDKDSVTFFSVPPAGSNINPEGEEIKAGEVLWPSDRLLNPAAVGCLATFGIEQVKVYPPPSVTLITTGDEIVPPGAERGYGQIYDSVSPMLGAVLRSAGVEKLQMRRCRDSLDLLQRTVEQAARETDLVASVGGVSAGDYDFISESAERVGFKKIFWKVAQKPGMPLYFAQGRKCLFFGLPGNPAAALVCCLLYVLPALRKFMGHPDPGPRWREGRLAVKVSNPSGRTLFLRAAAREESPGDWRLEPSGAQSSYMLGSFARSEALVKLPPERVILEQGARVQFTPHFWSRR